MLVDKNTFRDASLPFLYHMPGSNTCVNFPELYWKLLIPTITLPQHCVEGARETYYCNACDNLAGNPFLDTLLLSWIYYAL